MHSVGGTGFLQRNERVEELLDGLAPDLPEVVECGLKPERTRRTLDGVTTITGWVEEINAFGFRIAGRWVRRAEGAVGRPVVGDYAEVELDAEGYAVGVQVRAWRPGPQNLN